MKTVTLGVSSLEETKQRMAAAFRGEKQRGDHLSFVSIELLWKMIAPRRWEIMKAMAGKGPVSLRSVSRAVGRDVKTVHGDVHALLNAGILKKTEDGKILFPYDAIHVDFMIHGMAA
jgi:predicted transcriptional regulator